MTFNAGVTIHESRVIQRDAQQLPAAPIVHTGQPAQPAHPPLDLPEALRLLAERALHLLGAAGTRVLLGSDCRPVASTGTLAGKALSDDERSICEIAIGERHLHVAGRSAAAPMLADGAPIGVLYTVALGDTSFPNAALEQLERLADLGALTIRHVELLARAERSAGEARALAEIVQHINQSLELDRVFELVARHAMELLGGRSARLGMLDGPTRDTLVLVADAGDSRDQVGTRFPIEGTIGGACIRHGRALHTVLDARSEHAFTVAHAPNDSRSAVAAPLLVGQRPLGAIVVYAGAARIFDAEDERLLTALASHAAIAIENARLYRASVRTMRHASVLATAARSLALNTTPAATYEDIGRIARASLGADGVAIYIADPETRRASVAYGTGNGSSVVPTLVLPTFWDTAVGYAVTSGSAHFRSDVRDFPDDEIVRALIAQGVTSVAVLPLVVEGRPRGLLVLRYCSRQEFAEDQRALLLDFATQVAVAVRNALLFDDLGGRVTQLRAITELQQAISAAISMDEVYHELYRAVSTVVDSPCFTLLRFDEERKVFIPELVISDGTPMDADSLPRLPLGDGPTSQAFRTREPNVTMRGGSGWTGVAYEAKGERSIAVVLSAPIVHGERVLGVLQAQSYDVDAYDATSVDLTMLIAQQAATAMVNAMAYEAERREREQSEAAAAIARVALRVSDAKDAAEEMLAIVGPTVRADGIALGLLGEDGVVRCIARRGSVGVSPTEPMSLTFDAPDVTVPLSAAGRLVGVVRAAPVRGKTFGSRDIAPLTRLAAPIALALDSLLMRAEERRQQMRQRMLAEALQTMDQPVFIFAPDRTVRFANAAATRQYGYSHDELHDMSLQQLAVRPRGQREEDDIAETLETSGVWVAERVHRRKDGTEFPCWVVMSAIRDAEGRPIGLVGVMRDLTDERKVADQLRQSEKLAALGELVAGVAHEVNNPLTGISAMTQLLMEEPLSEEQLESLRLVKREADRAVAVIRDLLTFARKTGPRAVRVDFNALIEQTLRLRTYGLRTAGVQVDLHLAEQLEPVDGDDRLMQQVLLNLIVNAEHAMASVTRRVLTIRTMNQAGRVIIEIADTGVGMTPDVQKRVFEPFFTTKPEGRGTGLGLSVSYGIVQTHGGTLTVHTAPGAGATFRISLPAAGNRPASSSQRRS
ncbi:MAG TPA: GAF domain-containing protein [Gemmatimonadaceae bacterium]|nr:GAF domain-containing protein [Gemmatimonadaceae bacterium]